VTVSPRETKGGRERGVIQTDPMTRAVFRNRGEERWEEGYLLI